MSGNIRIEVRQTLQRYHFPSPSMRRAEYLLVKAIRYARVCRKKLPKDYLCPITGHYIPYKKMPRGRGVKEMRIRFLIMHALFTAWRHAFGSDPIINNRGNHPQPFVQFAEDIFIGERIANTEDNLEAYRSYIRRLLKIFSKRKSVMSTHI